MTSIRLTREKHASNEPFAFIFDVANLVRQLPTFTSRVVVRTLGKRRGCPRLSKRRNRLVVKSGAGVGIPGGAHKSTRLCCRTSDSPCSWSSVKILIHDCWFVSQTLKSTPALIANLSGSGLRMSFRNNSLS